jgi:hypothetical protein
MLQELARQNVGRDRHLKKVRNTRNVFELNSGTDVRSGFDPAVQGAFHQRRHWAESGPVYWSTPYGIGTSLTNFGTW